MKFQLKLLSLFLQYPDETLDRSLPSITESMENLPNSSSKQKLAQFMAYLDTTPLIRVRETYTETFDLNPSTCLNMTYHILGDDEKRGKIMSHLQEIYHQKGYETITGELPDYLPLILEFLSECPASAGSDLLWSYLSPAESLAAVLKDSDNPYSLLLEIVSDFAREYRSQIDFSTKIDRFYLNEFKA